MIYTMTRSMMVMAASGVYVNRAMGLLTTASPCALVLVPLAYVSAIAAITSRCRTPSHSAALAPRDIRREESDVPYFLTPQAVQFVLYQWHIAVSALSQPGQYAVARQVGRC